MSESNSFPSRRDWMRYTGTMTAFAATGGASSLFGAPSENVSNGRRALTAADVIADLMAGNARFVAGTPKSPRRRPEDYRALSGGQFPEAAIIACSDSRVPPEILFDQGVGDLFVIRVAGNVVGGSGAVVKGSIEYSVAELNVPLIVVLGHSNCGAVKAAVAHIDGHEKLPGSIDGLVDLIKPAVAKVQGQPGDKLANAIRANVALGVERIKSLEPLLATPVREGKLKVVGATYDLATGRVEMLV